MNVLSTYFILFAKVGDLLAYSSLKYNACQEAPVSHKKVAALKRWAFPCMHICIGLEVMHSDANITCPISRPHDTKMYIKLYSQYSSILINNRI